MIYSYKKRKKSYNDFKKKINEPSNVLLINYSYSYVNIEQTEISPIITAITIRSLDRRENKYFSIIREAEKADIEIEDIEDNYDELEFSVLKAFNTFLKEHDDYIWIHWEMSQENYGFEAIKHRFNIIANELGKALESISANNIIDLNHLLEDMYGKEYTQDTDKLKSLMIENSFKDTQIYLTSKKESEIFNNKNFSLIQRSLQCKMDFMFIMIDKLSTSSLKIPHKNTYSIFIEIISHPLFHLIGWVATITSTYITVAN